MSLLPRSLTTFSAAWWQSLVVLVIADVASMIATFMPMKVILILASGDVPGFFPQFLVDGGAVFASVVLLALAAGFGVLAWLGGLLVTQWDTGRAGSSRAEHASGADWSAEAVRQATQTRGFAVSLVLVAPVSAVLLVVSPPYLGFTGLWVLASGIGVIWWVRRSSQGGPYVSGVDQVSYGLAGWLRKSALWSMVGLALVTLLVAPPSLGSTAILIAAIFGRRLIMAVADVVPRATVAVTSAASKRAEGLVGQVVTNQPTAQTVRWPIEFLSTAVGSRKWAEYVRAAGYAPRDFVVLGAPTGPSLSLLVGPDQDKQLLVRIFGAQHASLRDAELTRRSEAGQSGLYPVAETSRAIIAGFPALTVQLDSPSSRVDTATAPNREQVIGFQLEREIASLEALAGVSTAVTMKTAEDYIDNLERLCRIPGDHVEPCRALIPMMPRAVELVRNVPVVLVPQRPLGPADCYVAGDQTLSFLGGVTWSVGRMGDSWGKAADYERILDAQLERHESGPGAVSPPLAALNAELGQLNRALVDFRLGQIAGLARAVQTRMGTLA